MGRIRFNLTIGLLLQVTIAEAQPVIFHRVLPPEGKTFEHVTSITQDKTGFLWLATKRGLYRYDGYRYSTYKNNSHDQNSIVSDALEAVVCDSSGNIWIGTGDKGLDKLDPVTGIFTHFRFEANDSATLPSDGIRKLFVSKDGVLWIGTTQGLCRFDTAKSKFIRYLNNPSDSTSISCNDITNIFEDRRGTLWIATGSVYNQKLKAEEGGLNRMDRKTGRFKKFVNHPGDTTSLTDNRVKAMEEDRYGNFWIGTAGDGLHIMDREKGTFRRFPYDPHHPEKLSRPRLNKYFYQYDHISFINEDVNGGIWIGTTESGLNYYDPVKKKIIHFESIKDTANNYGDRTAWASFNTKEGITWISGLSGKLYRAQTSTWSIPFENKLIKDVSSFYEDNDGTLWIGSYEEGLLHTDSSFRILHHYRDGHGHPDSLGSLTVSALKGDHLGNLWIGTEYGLDKLDKKTGIFKHFRHNPSVAGSLGNNLVRVIYEDRQNRLWVGTHLGLNLMFPGPDTFRQYIFFPGDTNVIGQNFISAIVQTKDGKIWIGSTMGGGIHLLDTQGNEIRSYLIGNSIVGLFEDSAGTVWGGGNNFYQFDKTTDSFYQFSDPMSTSEITNANSLINDNNGAIWLANPDGIKMIDMRAKKSADYGSKFNVNAYGFNYGSSYRTRNGKIFFGHAEGFYHFFPGDPGKGIPPPIIALTDFRLANNTVQSSSAEILTAPLSESKMITLNYNQNIFSIDFAVIDYNFPESNQVLYMLEHYDNAWRTSGLDHRGYYFNIPPGEYVFHVKGSNGYGIWAEKTIKIIIRPPWWRTWWAYLLFAITIFGIIWSIVYFRSYQLRKENRKLEEKVARRTAQLQQSLDELKSTQKQLIQSEKMASLGELTAGIAHEIQNPLNFVNNFSEVSSELLEEAGVSRKEAGENSPAVDELLSEVKENLTKINFHGKRADAIVKGMLQHSRAGTGQKEPTDINALAEEYLQLAYHGYRGKGAQPYADNLAEIKLKTDKDVSIEKINIVPQDIGRVLLNLYNNAFYAVCERKKVEGNEFVPVVELTTKKINDIVEIRIRDNGGGIPERVLEKVFQPFFTTKPTGTGTGLGLSLSYDIIKAHGGEIQINNEPGRGVEFIVVLSMHSHLV
ncbi:two-component regulator propeller domain-containing protein [Pollutibacter soli]|uniref:two-component regulator propeller domain-containing protein n=1 Tax=Pollutibacter soli TaxID=3034157 RepID=UPI0030141B7F